MKTSKTASKTESKPRFDEKVTALAKRLGMTVEQFSNRASIVVADLIARQPEMEEIVTGGMAIGPSLGEVPESVFNEVEKAKGAFDVFAALPQFS